MGGKLIRCLVQPVRGASASSWRDVRPRTQRTKAERRQSRVGALPGGSALTRSSSPVDPERHYGPARRSGRPRRRRCPRPPRASPPRPCGVVDAPPLPGVAGAPLLLGASRFQPTAGTHQPEARQVETHQAATHRCLRARSRPRSGTPPPSTHGRPPAGAGAGASCDRHRSHCEDHRVTNHADGRKPRRGDTRLPAAFARMGIAVRSSVRSSAGVPGTHL